MWLHVALWYNTCTARSVEAVIMDKISICLYYKNEYVHHKTDSERHIVQPVYKYYHPAQNITIQLLTSTGL